MALKCTNKYDDIIGMEHHSSKKHPHLSMEQRAAQFSPFAALTGHEEAVKETARHTDEKLELDESAKAEIDQVLQYLLSQLHSRPRVQLTYFEKDARKEGGTYISLSGRVKAIDSQRKSLRLLSGEEILWDDLYQIKLQGECLE